MEGEEEDSFLQEAVKIDSNSVINFAHKIVQAVFQPEVLQNCNCSKHRETDEGMRPQAFIVSRCLEPLTRHEARVFGIASS